MQIQFCNTDYYRFASELERKRNAEMASHRLPLSFPKKVEKDVLQSIYKGRMVQMNTTQSIQIRIVFDSSPM